MNYFNPACPPGSITYIIRPGDTLYIIAKRFNVSVPAIISANPFTNPNILRIGQAICVPVKPCTGSIYILKAGDTIYSIAKIINSSVDELLSLNPEINPNRLFIGQKICVPKKKCISNFVSYTIKAGDTLYSLAKTYSTSVNAIQAANSDLNPDLLHIGSNICIPKGQEFYINNEYAVSLFYPISWVYVDDTTFEGEDGYFKIGAISSDQGLETVCESEANHILKPYGSNPKTEKTVIDKMQSCFIFPSEDQPEEMKNQAAVIITYPKPVVIAGQNYNYFILWSDKEHIIQLSKTINLLQI